MQWTQPGSSYAVVVCWITPLKQWINGWNVQLLPFNVVLIWIQTWLNQTNHWKFNSIKYIVCLTKKKVGNHRSKSCDIKASKSTQQGQQFYLRSTWTAKLSHSCTHKHVKYQEITERGQIRWPEIQSHAGFHLIVAYKVMGGVTNSNQKSLLRIIINIKLR